MVNLQIQVKDKTTKNICDFYKKKQLQLDQKHRRENNLAMILGKANRYVVVRTGCIPVGLMLKGIYGSTSVTGDPPCLSGQKSCSVVILWILKTRHKKTSSKKNCNTSVPCSICTSHYISVDSATCIYYSFIGKTCTKIISMSQGS